MSNQQPPEKHEVMIWDDAGEHPTGPTISRYTQSGQIYVNGMRAAVTGLEEEEQRVRVIIGWDVETAQGWEHREQRIRLDQFHHLIYGHDLTPSTRPVLIEARYEVITGYVPQALKALDELYHTSFEDQQDRGQSYEQERQKLERQVKPLGFTISFAECGDAGAGDERHSYGGMRHVLLPLPL